jgi:hypothetical protein
VAEWSAFSKITRLALVLPNEDRDDTLEDSNLGLRLSDLAGDLVESFASCRDFKKHGLRLHFEKLSCHISIEKAGNRKHIPCRWWCLGAKESPLSKLIEGCRPSGVQIRN